MINEIDMDKNLMIDVVELVDNNIVAMNDYVEGYMMMIDQLIQNYAKIKNNEIGFLKIKIIYIVYTDTRHLYSCLEFKNIQS